MKTAAFIVTCILSFGTFQAKATMVENHPFGAGIMLGNLSGVTGKYWLGDRTALDFGLGFAGHRGVALYGDYLWHIPGLFGSGTKFGRETSAYVGGGGGVATWSDSYECGRWDCDRRDSKSGTGVFLRGIFGFEWFPATTQFGVFAEIGPTFLLSPSVNGSLDLSIGGRYYF